MSRSSALIQKKRADMIATDKSIVRGVVENEHIFVSNYHCK